MSNNSKGKAIADLLLADVSRYRGWDELLEGLIPGFSMVPKSIQFEIIEAYETYMTHARSVLDERGYMLLRDGRAINAKWKVATPNDIADIERVLEEQQKRGAAIDGRVEKRIENLKKANILPPAWSPTLNA